MKLLDVKKPSILEDKKQPKLMLSLFLLYFQTIRV